MRHKTGNGHNVDIEHFLDDIKAVVRDGQELLRAGAVGMREKAIQSAETTDRAVRSHPYQTLGIVFGVGMLAGLLLSGAFASPESRTEAED